MATAGQLGFGTKLKIGDGASPELFTDVAEIRNIDLSAFSQDFADATSMDSTGGFRERVPTLKTAETVTCEMVATASGLTQLQGLATANTLKNYQISIPAPITKTISFAAYLGGWTLGAPVEDLLSCSVTFQISGAVTIA